jgi:hypothetical protein
LIIVAILLLLLVLLLISAIKVAREYERRYLQTLLELGSSQATTIVLPVDLIRPSLEKAGGNS